MKKLILATCLAICPLMLFADATKPPDTAHGSIKSEGGVSELAKAPTTVPSQSGSSNGISQPITEEELKHKIRCSSTPMEEYLFRVRRSIVRALWKSGTGKTYPEWPGIDGELQIDQHGRVLNIKIAITPGHERNDDFMEAVVRATESAQPYEVVWDGPYFKGTLPLKFDGSSGDSFCW